MGEGDGATDKRIGLCATCHYVRAVRSERGSVFYLCERSLSDVRFPKYPRLPVLACQGYVANQPGKQNPPSGPEGSPA